MIPDAIAASASGICRSTSQHLYDLIGMYDLPISLSSSQSSDCLDFIKAIISLISGLLPRAGTSTMASASVSSSFSSKIASASVSSTAVSVAFSPKVLIGSSNEGELRIIGLVSSKEAFRRGGTGNSATLLRLIIESSVVSLFRPVGDGDAFDRCFTLSWSGASSSNSAGSASSTSSSSIGDRGRLGAVGSSTGNGGRGIGSGGGKLTRVGDDGESGSGGRGSEIGRLSGLLDTDGPASDSVGSNIEFGLDRDGYRSGKGEKAGSASASNSKSAWSTNMENLAEVLRDVDSPSEDLDERRDEVVVDSR